MDRMEHEKEFPAPTQRDASAHPGMTNFILVHVFHADAMDEFPKQRQELLGLGKEC